MLQNAEKYAKEKRRVKRRRGILTGLAAVVVFCTTYALILPAITMSDGVFCGIEEHRHGDECYENVLVCTLEETEEETPDSSEPEPAPAHVHTDACYQTQPVLICGQEEREWHVHSEMCYDETGALVCQLPEDAGHAHSDECYGEERVLTCGIPEGVAAAQPEPAAPAGHKHGEGCYARELICTKEEHTHSLACYSDPAADLESPAVWEATLPAELPSDIREAFAAVAESQIGYSESSRNYQVGEDGAMHGYTRYGAWYGFPYGDWCAMFVSFCANYAGVPHSAFTYESGCIAFADGLNQRGLLVPAAEHIPQRGDVVFFDTDGDGAADHTGIVTGLVSGEAEGTYFRTVEGNVNNCVAECTHYCGEPGLLGYGLLPVTAEDEPADNNEAQENGEEQRTLVCEKEAHTHSDDCYNDEGELVCGLEEHAHTDDCYEKRPLTEEELAEIEAQFTGEVEELEALDELTEEDVSNAEDLLERLEKAYKDEELSEEVYTGLYARVLALLADEYADIAEPSYGTNWILLRDSGWFEEYSGAAYTAYEAPAVYAFPAELPEDTSPSGEQVDARGGVNAADGVSVSKTITGTELENVFDITLQVQTPQTINEVVEEPDMAVVIVMDISNTMNSNFGGTTRYEAAMATAEDFLDKFADSNSLGISRIGYVAFNTDAHQIFGLQPCTNQQQAAALKNTMRQSTGNIINDAGYKDSHSRFTNIEAGLKMAQDMLSGVSNKEKFIVFLSDGFPTTYISSGYNGYDPYDSTGRFYDHVLNKPCTYGTSYSDEAAIRARNTASSIKGSGITIFSIGVDVGGQNIQAYIEQSEKANGFSVVDRSGTSYEIGAADRVEAYENWLRGSIGSGYYYPSTDVAGLKSAYDEIFDEIKKTVETAAKADWVASDPVPMAESGEVEFIGFFNRTPELVSGALNGSHIPDGENTASFAGDVSTISWDLKKSGYRQETSGSTTLYTYSLTYRVRLENEDDGFIEKAIYATNGRTTLSYSVVRDDNGTLTIEKKEPLEFPVPSVHGYLGELEFIKKDNRGNALPGAEFTLSHDQACSICRGDKTAVSIKNMIAVSGEDGKVSFTGIPSGHTYTLTETAVPPGYTAGSSSYKVTVAYDKTTVKVLGPDHTTELEWNGVIVNNTYYELPDTGGSGTIWYTASGALLIFAAAGLYICIRRRKEERETS